MANTFDPRSVQYTAVNATSDGANTLIPDPGDGRKILVLSYSFRVLGAGTATLAVTGGNFVMIGIATTGMVYQLSGPDGEVGVFTVPDSTALVATMAAGIDLLGHISYRIVDA